MFAAVSFTTTTHSQKWTVSHRFRYIWVYTILSTNYYSNCKQFREDFFSSRDCHTISGYVSLSSSKCKRKTRYDGCFEYFPERDPKPSGCVVVTDTLDDEEQKEAALANNENDNDNEEDNDNFDWRF